MAKFRTSARTVDMLGRQQIAGAPTAISELFKNAYDAYATQVKVDLLREQNILVIRDNGVGMSLQDFEDRWLVLSTDSKLAPQRVPRGHKRRMVLGEKGIGRLAIAVLGPQVLVMTRAREGKTAGSLTLALVNWRLFQLPTVGLDRIEIPTKTLGHGHLPAPADIRDLKNRVSNNASVVVDDPGILSQIRSDLELFDDDIATLDRFLGEPSLNDAGTGTQFFVSPVDEVVLASLKRKRKGDASDLDRLLLGFTNTMVPGHAKPPMHVGLTDHQTHDRILHVAAEGEFFTPEEFLGADHRVQGRFDSNGWFRGEVVIYGLDAREYEIPPPDGVSVPTRSGPFDFAMAVVQPESKSTTLSPESHAQLKAKTNRIGSLYVYRDGIRVLPYGDVANDWLKIEENRTKQAAYYYFSHRNMFGAASITKIHNPDLVDKAGREGFQRNAAYRDFVGQLENLMVHLAADFFRGTGVRSEEFTQEKARLNALYLAKQENELHSAAARKSLAKALHRASDYLEQQLQHDLRLAWQQIETSLTEVATASALVQAEAAATRSIRSIRSRMKVNEPDGVGLDQILRDRLGAFEYSRSTAEAELLDPLEHRVAEQFQRAAERLAEQDYRQWALSWSETLIAETGSATEPIITAVEHELRRILGEVADVRISIVESLEGLQAEFESVVAEAGPADSKSLRQARLALIDGVATWDQIDDVLGADLALFQRVSISVDRQTPNPLLALKAFEEEAIGSADRARLDLEMIQLGNAVDILSHEFDDSIRSVRSNLRRLGSWANANPDLSPLHQDLVSSFEHLDGYLKLLTPLARRLYRSKSKLTGKEIHRYLSDLFGERLARQEVTLKATRSFNNWSIESYRSTFYPVFVNLVDNAIFWLRHTNHPRTITLDAKGGALLVSDTGPGVPQRDLDRVFERGFTRKPGGRGLGLYISRQVLGEQGFDIRVVLDATATGASFIIGPKVPSDT